MDKIYYILDENGFLVSYNYYSKQPENSTDVPIKETFNKAKFNGTEWIDGGVAIIEQQKEEAPKEVLEFIETLKLKYNL